MKSSMTFIHSNGCTGIDLILKQIWRRFIWRQVNFKVYSLYIIDAIIILLSFMHSGIQSLFYNEIHICQFPANYRKVNATITWLFANESAFVLSVQGMPGTIVGTGEICLSDFFFIWYLNALQDIKSITDTTTTLQNYCQANKNVHSQISFMIHHIYNIVRKFILKVKSKK